MEVNNDKEYVVHEAVFEKDASTLEQLLKTGNHDVNKKDKFGNTPLHLASMLGCHECIDVLAHYMADANIKNLNGWTPLAEAVSYGKRKSIKTILRRIKQQNRTSLDERRPKLVEKLKELQDFELELKWEFHSWVPLISRLLPSDICKISKKGANIRMDTTLIEFTDMKWQRGDITFLFNGSKPGSDSLVVLDNEKKVYQKLRKNDVENDIDEEVDYLMCSDVVAAQMSTKPITFAPVQSGWIFKEDKTEIVGKMQCKVYHVQGMTLLSKKRREHLSEEDLKKNKELIEAFHRGDSMLMENEKCQPLPRKDSLPPPPECPFDWKQYSSMENPPFIGRGMKLTEQRKALKVNVWMSDEFPLSIELLLNVLNVVAPSKHFEKMKEFVSMKLPPGFPVKIGRPLSFSRFVVNRILVNTLRLKQKWRQLGAVKRYSYPKYVWSPSGGWWCNPRNWKRNLAFVYLATAAICVPIVWLDWQLERRYCPPPKPVWSQRFCKHSAEDDPRFAK